MKIVKRLLTLILLLLLFLALSVVVFVSYSLERTALVSNSDSSQNLTEDYLGSVTTQVSPSGLITIGDRQLGNLAQQILRQRRIPSDVRIRFVPNEIQAAATIRAPIDSEKKYLNIQIKGAKVASPQHIQIEDVRVGSIKVPSIIIDLLGDYALARCTKDRRCRTGLNTYQNIDSIDLDTGVLSVRYTLGADTFNLLGKTDIDDLELEPYQRALENLSQQNNRKSIKLQAALHVVMQVASTRSDQNDPVRENAAALMALAMLDADRKVQEILVQPGFADWPVNELRLKVHNRRDLAQHFVNSAALFLIGGTEFSDYVGIYKEVYDVSSGKEFGTGDLIADRAGVRFAQRATRSQRLAINLQQQILDSSDSSGYLLSKAEIKRFENEHSVNATDQIGAIVTVIDRELRKLPLLN